MMSEHESINWIRTAITDKVRLGHAGDILKLDGKDFEITLVRKIPLRDAVREYCHQNGYTGPWPMAEAISKRYPDLEWKDPVFVHVVKVVSEGCL